MENRWIKTNLKSNNLDKTGLITLLLITLSIVGIVISSSVAPESKWIVLFFLICTVILTAFLVIRQKKLQNDRESNKSLKTEFIEIYDDYIRINIAYKVDQKTTYREYKVPFLEITQIIFYWKGELKYYSMEIQTKSPVYQVSGTENSTLPVNISLVDYPEDPFLILGRKFGDAVKYQQDKIA